MMLVVAHDAGAAEVVAAWVKRNRRPDDGFLLDGPAVSVFRRTLGPVDILDRSSLDASIAAAAFVLTGTGYSSDLEISAVASARLHHVRVASYLDHWTNYPVRFLCHGEQVLPDEVWAGDHHALALARRTFPHADVKLVPNQYFEDMKEQIGAVARPPAQDRATHVLFVAEPTSVAAQKEHGDPRYWGYTEFDALDGYLSYLRDTGNNIEVLLRPHPAEPPGKYSAVIEKHRSAIQITESTGRTLVEDCAWADWVVGCQSMAMVIALHAGKRVFSCIPKGGPALPLPYPEIVRLFNG